MRVLLFDIDGTLLSSGGAGQAAMEDALESAFGITAPTEGIPVAGRTDRAITADMLRFHGIADTEPNRVRFHADYVSHLPTQLAAREGLILPGVTELLQRLSTVSHCCLGLLTGNFRRGAEIKLSHFRLLEHFRCGGYGDDHYDRDDVARAAHANTCEFLRCNALSDVWVIGDTPSDVKCGRAIGARVIAVSTGHYSIEELRQTGPDYVVQDLSDIDDLMLTLTT